MEDAGADGNSTMNPSCGIGYSFHCAEAVIDVVRIARPTKILRRKAHLLGKLPRKWYKHTSPGGCYEVQTNDCRRNCRRVRNSGFSAPLVCDVRQGKADYRIGNTQIV